MDPSERLESDTRVAQEQLQRDPLETSDVRTSEDQEEPLLDETTLASLPLHRAAKEGKK